MCGAERRLTEELSCALDGMTGCAATPPHRCRRRCCVNRLACLRAPIRPELQGGAFAAAAIAHLLLSRGGLSRLVWGAGAAT